MRLQRGMAVLSAVAIVFIAGCNRNTPAAPESAKPVAPSPAKPQASKPAIPLATALVANTVESLTVTRPQDAPGSIFIQASGTVLSEGWTNPRLVPTANPSGETGTRRFSLVATSPVTAPTTMSAQPIDAELRVEMLPDDVKTIRVVSSTNEVAATIGSP